ncbi:hypothetical protein [Candidatus Stoquefichus massiliensis]|uniref:hypothetical protein n=1 Tax=Candidatus Stoquefichus massiliensis TaxID=1470350 RepID=UPI0004891E1D|nr:hypothetical protein [Candidatus Stoquefichus massiliensis]
MLHYLPGCDVFKNHPEASLKIQKYMKKHHIMIDKCCRVKESFLTNEDTIIMNCTLCELVLKETHPNTKQISLYEYVLNDPDFPYINHKGESIIIQDCWRTKDNLSLQNAVRLCLQKMNFTIIEMPENYSYTKYCGVWLNNYPSQDCIDVAPYTMKKIIENDIHLLSESEQLHHMQQWCQQYSFDKIVVYCNGCEKGINLGGKQPLHMIELLAEALF